MLLLSCWLKFVLSRLEPCVGHVATSLKVMDSDLRPSTKIYLLQHLYVSFLLYLSLYSTYALIILTECGIFCSWCWIAIIIAMAWFSDALPHRLSWWNCEKIVISVSKKSIKQNNSPPNPIESSDPLTKDMLNLNWKKTKQPSTNYLEFLTLWWQGDLNEDFIN